MNTTTDITQTRAREIGKLHRAIVIKARTSLEDAIRIGELLTEQKDELEHGQWLPWLKDNVEFAHATASRYMGVYEKRVEISHCEKFDLTEAYRLLAGPKRVKEQEPQPTTQQEPEPELEVAAQAEVELEHEQPRVRTADEVMQKVGRCPVDGAIQFAAAAIAQLEEIANDDPDRNQALKRVQCYLEQRAGRSSKAKPSKALRLMNFWWGKADRKDQALFWETTVSGGAL